MMRIRIRIMGYLLDPDPGGNYRYNFAKKVLKTSFKKLTYFISI